MIKAKRFVLSGQTSSGKNFIGANAVSGLPFEIISLDSMKVFKYMDIGTAKPTSAEQNLVKHWMINVCDPRDYFDANMFYEKSEEIAQDIENRGKNVLYVGGTPMYLRIIQNKLFEGPAADDKIRDKLRNEITEQGLAVLHERLAKVDE
ncbi:MAG: tRNA (adenosine(37)-N6)-dimethylallyltransferase MiaA, partial [Planctomycetes bacterium]|nr:tRNA (adenosine(37)-N6)-dimethylallyltransferase MiaA [Planctomycetota bacterium]